MKKILCALAVAGASLTLAPQLAWAWHGNRPASYEQGQYSQSMRYQGDNYSNSWSALPRKYRAGGY